MSLRHDDPPSAQTWVSITAGDGSAPALANASASATFARVSASIASRAASSTPAASEPRPLGRDRVARLPRLDLVVRPVLAGIGPGVAAVAVRQRLDERRTVAGARPVDRPGRDRVDRLDVVAVDDDRLEAVGGGPVRRRPRDRRHVADRRVLHVLVVLADEHDRRLPDDRHVQRLVERADVRRPVAEEADRDLAGLPVLGGPRRPERDRQVGADDRVRAHHVVARRR